MILFCDKKQISDVSHTFTFSVGFFKNKIDLQFTEGSFFKSAAYFLTQLEVCTGTPEKTRSQNFHFPRSLNFL